MKDDYFRRFRLTKEIRPDEGTNSSLPSGYKLRWVGRLMFKSSEMYWNDVFVGRIIKAGKKWMAIPASAVHVCPTCQMPANVALTNGKGLRCSSPENQYLKNSAFVGGKWTHEIVWVSYQLFPSKDHATMSLIPKGE